MRISNALFEEIVDAAPHDADRPPTLSAAVFSRATFEGDAGFLEMTFKGGVWFNGATFKAAPDSTERSSRPRLVRRGELRERRRIQRGDLQYSIKAIRRQEACQNATDATGKPFSVRFVKAERAFPICLGTVLNATGQVRYAQRMVNTGNVEFMPPLGARLG